MHALPSFGPEIVNWAFILAHCAVRFPCVPFLKKGHPNSNSQTLQRHARRLHQRRGRRPPAHPAAPHKKRIQAEHRAIATRWQRYLLAMASKFATAMAHGSVRLRADELFCPLPRWFHHVLCVRYFVSISCMPCPILLLILYCFGDFF